MYKIIGADQKEYGPETVAQIEEWILDGRADGRTLAREMDSDQWQPLARYPEFAAALAKAPVPQFPGRRAAGDVGYAGLAGRFIARGPAVDMGACFRRAGELLTKHFGLLVRANLLIWTLSFLSLMIPFCQIFFQGVLFGGLSVVYLRCIRGQQTVAAEALRGFGPRAAQLVLVGVVSTLLAYLAGLLFFLPYVLLTVLWIFSIPLVAEKEVEFWTAMELSRTVVSRVWFKVFGLLCLSFAPYLIAQGFMMYKILGDFAAGLQAGPMPGFVDMLSRLEQYLSSNSQSFVPLALMVEVVFLLNLPFGMAVLMYAYEDLFGPRAAQTA